MANHSLLQMTAVAGGWSWMVGERTRKEKKGTLFMHETKASVTLERCTPKSSV